MTASRYDAERLWVGSDVAGVFRSDDGGRSYTTCNDGNENLFIECIAEHPTDPDVLLIGTFGGVYKSTDRGRTWTLKRNGFPPCAPNRRTVIVSRLIWDRKGAVWASLGAPRYSNMGRGELYRSVDDGDTWENVVPDGAMDKSWAAMDMALVGDDILIATPTNGIVRSADGGRTWRTSNDGLPHLRTRRFAQSAKDPNCLYLTLRGKAGETPWNSPPMRSDDGGRTWRSCGTKGLETSVGKAGAADMNCSWYDRIAVSPDDADTVYLAGGSWWCKGIWKSTDGGMTWTRKFSGKDNSGWLKSWNDAAQCLAVSPLPPYAVTFGTGCAVYRSVDGGETWEQRYTRTNADGTSRSIGLELTCMHSIQSSPRRKGRFYFNYFDVGAFIVDDYGRSFRQIMKGIPKYWDCFAIAEDPQDAEHLYGAFGTWSRDSGFIGESTDGGANWQLLSAATNAGWRCATPRSLALVGDRPPYTLAAQVSRRLLMLSADGGRSWRQVTTNEFPEAEAVSRVVAKDGRLYVGTSVDKTHIGSIWTSADRGRTWRKLSNGVNLGTVMSIAVDGDRVFAATRHGWNKTCGEGKGGAWYSPDGGRSWRLVFENKSCTDVVIVGERLLVSMTDHPYHDRCRGGGVVCSTDCGLSWRELNEPSLGNRNIGCLCVDPNDPRIVIAGSGGNSAFIRRLPPQDAGGLAVRYDVIIAGGTDRAVAAAEACRRKGRSVCVLAPRNYLGEDCAGNLTCLEQGMMPLDAKRSLDRRLLACGAEFMTGVFVLSVSDDEVRCASSSGEFVLGCGEFLDCRIASPENGFARAARIVVSGTAPSAPGMTVLSLPGDYTTVVTNRVKEDGDGRVHVVSGKVWRCEFDLPFSVNDAFGKSAAELLAREKTWVPDLLDGADELIPLESKGRIPPTGTASCAADVVVVGGGVAGVPAAVAAARAGAKVILIEELRQLGGMGTAGGIGQYWQGRRDGLTAEYDQRVRDLAPSVHVVGKREAWRRMAQEAGVSVLWGCAAYGVETDGGRIVAVKAATDYGPLRITARVFVDATGNANVAAAAGVPVVFLEKGPLSVQGSGVAWRPLGVGFMNTDWGYVDGSSVRDRTRFLACGRAGAEGIWDVSQLVGSRERRRIVGEVVLTDVDMATGRKFSDVIVQTCSNFDSHGPTADDLGLLPEPCAWLVNGAIPYRALLPKSVDNLLVAGLGISATRDALPIIRMQSDVQNTGYAVGVAAAQAAKRDGNCRTLDVRELQRKLIGEKRLSGAVLGWTDRTVSDAELAESVRSIAEDYSGAALVLSERSRAIPLLKAALAKEGRAAEKFRLAHVLGVLGEPDGAEILADWLQGKVKVAEPNLAKRPPYARRFDYRQSVIIALGRTKSPAAVAFLREAAQRLSHAESFFSHRAVCWAAESSGSREVGEILRRKAVEYPAAVVREGVRPKSGCSPKNHFMTEEEMTSLKSLDLATAIFRLTGDDSFLRPWLGDVREVYRLHAGRVLGNPAEARRME